MDFIKNQCDRLFACRNFDFVEKRAIFHMKISDTAQLGQMIRSRRKELRYTQAYLAEFTGFSVSFISDLENGKPTCEIGKALYLMSLLGLDIMVERRGSDAQAEGAD